MTEIASFVYDGEEVLFETSSRMWNLNAMHRATGSMPNKAPAQWLRTQSAQEICAALAQEGNYADLHSFTVKTREGRNGGTWAMPELALAYAHYLNPRFYIACNRWMLAQLDQPLPMITNDQLLAALNALTTEVAALRARIDALEAKPARTQQIVTDDLGEAIFVVLAAHGGGPMSTEEIRGALRRGGVPFTQASQIKTKLRRMAERGLLFKHGRALYALFPAVEPYEDQEAL